MSENGRNFELRRPCDFLADPHSRSVSRVYTTNIHRSRYDGRQRRRLTPAEIKQIAGRAGNRLKRAILNRAPGGHAFRSHWPFHHCSLLLPYIVVLYTRYRDSSTSIYHDVVVVRASHLILSRLILSRLVLSCLVCRSIRHGACPG